MLKTLYISEMHFSGLLPCKRGGTWLGVISVVGENMADSQERIPTDESPPLSFIQTTFLCVHVHLS